MKTSARALAVLASLIFVGCWGDGFDDEDRPPRLDEVTIPADHDFETTRPVALELAVSDALRTGGESVTIEVRRANGGLVFRGTVRSDSESGRKLVRVPLPLHMDELEVTARGDGWVQEASVTFAEDGTASYVFE